ncbi:MAG: class I SAM-dependent methyltransferase [Pirellulaceae bacterium]|nr:class I SAM-dependent methyltransferase [Planctomycetales bacterium]
MNRKLIKPISVAIAVMVVVACVGQWIWVDRPILLTAIGLAVVGQQVTLLLLNRVVRGDIEGHTARIVNVIDAYQRPLRRIRPRLPLPPLRVPGDWTITPDVAEILIDEICDSKPQCVVELGSGVSSLIIGYALEQSGGGHCYSLEHDAAYARASSELIARHGLADYVTVIHGAISDYEINGRPGCWYERIAWDSIDDIDLLFVDGPPASIASAARYPALPLLFDRLNSPCVVIMDDGERESDVLTVVRWCQEFAALACEYIATQKGAFRLRKG